MRFPSVLCCDCCYYGNIFIQFMIQNRLGESNNNKIWREKKSYTCAKIESFPFFIIYDCDTKSKKLWVSHYYEFMDYCIKSHLKLFIYRFYVQHTYTLHLIRCINTSLHKIFTIQTIRYYCHQRYYLLK